MRNLAIYGDKIFLATTDARLVALDAKTGKKVWDTTIADRRQGLLEHERADRGQGQGHPGPAGLRPLPRERCFISAYDADTGALAWKFNTVAHSGEPGGDTWNNLPEHDARRAARPGSPAATTRTSTSPTGAPRRPSRGCRRAAARGASTPRCTRLDGGAQSRHRRARVALPAPAGRSARPRRGVRARARRHRRAEGALHDRQVGHPVEARSQDRRAPRSDRRRSSRTSTPTSTEDRAGHLPRRHPRAEGRPVDPRLPVAPRAATTGRR